MTPQQLTEASTRASERYVVFLNSMRGVLSEVTRRDPADMRARRELREALLSVGRTFIQTEIDILEDEIDTAVRAGVADVSQDAFVDWTVLSMGSFHEELIDASSEALETELRAQIERDIQQAMRLHKDFLIEVHMISHLERVDLRTAQFRALLRHSDQVRFYFRDRAGRKHASQKFIRTVWRDALLQAKNEAFLLSAAAIGRREIRIDHPDRNSSFSDVMIHVNPQGDQLGYSDIRDDAFHPNSMARLRLA